jgi:hypothetical protein
MYKERRNFGSGDICIMKYQPTPIQMKNSNDDIQTPPKLAKAIVKYYSKYFKEGDTFLEPCRGDGNIYDELPEGQREYCEIKNGINFFDHQNYYYSWIVTNPPWSLFKDFLEHSFDIARNVIFLLPLNKVLGLKTTFKLIKENGFIIKNIKCWDTPPKPWPQSGFQIGTVWFQINSSWEIDNNNCIIDMKGSW